MSSPTVATPDGADGSAPDASSPETTDFARIEELLQAASLLLGRGEHLHAVSALHQEIRIALGSGGVEKPEQYISRPRAEEQHRELIAAMGLQRAKALRGPWWQDFRERLPTWTSWVVVVSIAGGLCLRYAWAVLDRTKWQRQHPEGNWISRYYSSRDFKGFPLVRYDVGVDYDWGRNAPAKAMVRDRWSARWDTCLVVGADTTLELQLTSDDSSKLILDDVPQIDIGPKPGTKTASVFFPRGTHRLRVDFQENQGEAVVRLLGLEFEGTEFYHFQRPVLEGDDVRCE